MENNAIVETQLEQYTRLDASIRNNRVLSGRDLSDMQQSKVYRVGGFKGFKGYLKNVGIARSSAYMLIKKHEAGETDRTRGDNGGYVYLVEALCPVGVYKIGRSKSHIERLNFLGVILPFPIEVVHLIKTNNMMECEKALHTKYANQRLNGEWFNLTYDDVSHIMSIDERNYHGNDS